MTIERKPESTRDKILLAAFQEMHKHGYQGMRIDQVLKSTGFKKGALYHHFPSKQALGYAVLEERIQKRINALWIEPLKKCDDPLACIERLFLALDTAWSDDFFYQGCPLNNLAQEMSPIDEGFRERIDTFFQYWQDTMSACLKRGQQQQLVDAEINTDDCALFIIAAIEGALGMTKNHRNKAVYFSCTRELKRYLNALKEK
ncbi:MAG: TetR family transcriptional regulator [Methyloprofundus sp.]|nr:TetR family transcriptional regulator [Methyloprofundus sp.]